MRQQCITWRCKACGRSGEIGIAEHRSYSNLLIKVDDAHRLAAPWCRPVFSNYVFCDQDVMVGKQ